MTLKPSRTAFYPPAPKPDPRPVWRKVVEFPLVTLLFAVATLAGVIAMGALALDVVLPFTPIGREPWWEFLLRGLVGVLLVLAAYKLAIRRFGTHKRDDLPFGPALGDTALGFLVGGALITAVVGIAALFGAYRITGWSEVTDAVRIIVEAGLVAGFVEEVLLRGIVFRWLEEFAGSWIALALSALLFGFLHSSNPNATLFSSLAIAIEAGVLLGGAYMLTRNLWLAIGIHAGWNVVQGLVWSVPVSGIGYRGMLDAELYPPAWLSGGAFGLEASVIALVVATAAGAWIVRAAIREGQVVRPIWRRSDALAGGVREDRGPDE